MMLHKVANPSVNGAISHLAFRAFALTLRHLSSQVPCLVALPLPEWGLAVGLPAGQSLS